MKVTEVIYFGVIYNLVFLGYYVSNGFLTILYPDEAFISFAIFYGVYAVFSLISPWILNKLNLKLSLIVSSFTFVIYVGSITSRISIIMLLGSGICGAGNALIWLSQGYWMSFIEENKGMLIGIFFGIFYANILLGNIIGLIILFISSIDVMLYVMLGINFIGFVLTFFIKTPSTNNIDKTDFKSVFTIIKLNRGYLLIGLFLTQAVALNVTYQIIPSSILNVKSTYTNVYTAFVFIAYGFSSMFFSLISGKIYDKFGKYPVIISYLFLEIFSLIGILLLNMFSNELGYYIIIGFIRGISDNAINAIINITIVSNYKEKSKTFFAIYRFIYALSYVAFAVLVAYIPSQYYLLLDVIIVIFSFIIFLFYRQVSSLEIKPSTILEERIEEQFDNNVVKL